MLSSLDESTPCVPVNVVIWLFVPLPLMIESPFSNNILCSKSFDLLSNCHLIESQSNEPEVEVPSDHLHINHHYHNT